MTKDFKQNVFQGRSVLAEKDFSAAELEFLIDFGLHLKALKKANIPHHYLEGKNIALLFEKSSTRTRSAFTTAAIDLGAHPEYLGAGDIQLGKKETTSDTAKVLGSMFDGIEFRGFKQSDAEILARDSGVPVWNGLTDEWHPTQMLADFMTVKENFNKLQGLTLTFMGDGRNNVANSLLVTGAILGVNVHIVAPKSLFPTDETQKLAQGFAKKSGAQLLVTDDLDKGLKGSNIVYTDVWVSMGESNWEERVNLLKPYQVNMEAMKKTETPDDQLIFMHCLPAFHNTDTEYGKDVEKQYGIKEMEVTDEVFNSKYARQFEEAENRMHSIKAIMAATLGNLFIPKV
ncbi:ornithine carbamoyltransferase [Lactobacillus mellis]|uniref:ornithine carbamoyltransferase n=1 Tax=Bombilactobacillus mellis TaxID=1218508 RepID=UPI001580E805|nr:ornithine carbamoyltransferase [Bombilactobacillus mellis]MBI0107993.1 ornithine carbamoyltransferase [Lactobacillus sp. W8086]MBI0109410.1 ornithine carbamoyltransferase [Lactobacillus sp. W8085]MBI0112675.1 ornithine carbamoyltransferase [Lactobacillus sp. W8088]MBI0116391.1 ornithine carbamoyltransferase [Lactobacillus sp. W8087]MBI0120067.1 ornithine carbamoyltransferase [Lactobacillus sp. W8089]MBI0132032.1 ornithine carbamoyltransferase [Lactobacillus sp. W8090]